MGHDLPDEALVAACLASYRSLASTSDRIVTSDDLLRRSHEHSEIVADLVDTGHRLGMRAWIASRDADPAGPRPPARDWLDESSAGPPGRSGARMTWTGSMSWQVRGRASFCSRSSGPPCSRPPSAGAPSSRPADIVRFLVIVPERTELVRYKLGARRSAGRPRGGQLASSRRTTCAFAARGVSLGELEPYLGLDPAVERQGSEQMPLFGA